MNLEDLQKQLNLELTEQERDILYEFTRAREVITFQASELPGVRYTLEFRSLAAARNYFAIPSSRQLEVTVQAERARRLKTAGMSKAKIAAALKVSLSTEKRYLRGSGGHEPLTKSV